MLEGKRVGVVCNHTAVVHNAAGTPVHLIDTLIARGIEVRAAFGPEHGFRGDLPDGEKAQSGTDTRSGIAVRSLYGTHKKPSAAQLEDIEIMVFDIQDVGRAMLHLSVDPLFGDGSLRRAGDSTGDFGPSQSQWPPDGRPDARHVTRALFCGLSAHSVGPWHDLGRIGRHGQSRRVARRRILPCPNPRLALRPPRDSRHGLDTSAKVVAPTGPKPQPALCRSHTTLPPSGAARSHPRQCRPRHLSPVYHGRVSRHAPCRPSFYTNPQCREQIPQARRERMSRVFDDPAVGRLERPTRRMADCTWMCCSSCKQAG